MHRADFSKNPGFLSIPKDVLNVLALQVINIKALGHPSKVMTASISPNAIHTLLDLLLAIAVRKLRSHRSLAGRVNSIG